ncbi:MAG: type I pullulanase [Erysipelotrichaceae bacterium]|nr:type I pullulanase [Erysipelotrichaceae bacterium]
MKDSFVKARLVSLKRVEIYILTNDYHGEDRKIIIVKDGRTPILYSFVNESVDGRIVRVVYETKEEFAFGHSYEVLDENGNRIFVDVSSATDFDNFDQMFAYEGNDLGPTYHKECTDFALWAPLASSVMISYYIGQEQRISPMTRGEKGIYRIRINGDLKNVNYRYLVTNSGIQRYANDPYAKSVSLNGESSSVVDLDNVTNNVKNIRFNRKSSKLRSIIYELSVRDFTIQRSTDIDAKGKFLGMVEKNRRTLKGEKAGFDYLLDLGITHIQLLPVTDFALVDDLDVRKSYNWGYDITSFFALDGSYSVNPSNPTSRLVEFKALINEMHANGIGVVMDVVYNHIFEYQNSDLEKIVPSYFFRKKKDGKMSNGSCCGNDLNTERAMVRKLIVDSAFYFADIFDVDGFRFDLMGMIDKLTIDELKKKILKIKPNFMFYGEGWNIATVLDEKKKVTIENAKLNPDISFFNDTFRDIIKGSSFDLKRKGYINGDYSYRDGMIYSFLGSCYKTIYDPKFVSISQSINYVECHDNNTLFDKLVSSNYDEDEETILKRVKLANALTILSLGIPFIHMGQELGLTKYGKDNTYNLLDRYNEMDYKMVESRREMITYFKSLVEMRKLISFYEEDNISKLYNSFEFINLNSGAIIIKNKKTVVKSQKGELLIVINPSKETIFYDLADYYYFLNAYKGGNLTGEIAIKNLTIPPISCTILFKKKH